MERFQIVLADGTIEERAMGNDIAEETPLVFGAVYGDRQDQPLIRREEWQPFVAPERYVPKIIDQDGVGKCNASTSIQCMQVLRAMRGYPFVELSDDYLYARINGGRDQGSVLSDALKTLRDEGTCLKSQWPDLEWRMRGDIATAKAESPKHRILEYFHCPTVDHVVSAVLSGWIVNTGLWWYSQDPLDADGWLTMNPRGSRGGHAVCRLSLHERNGKWGLGGPNSWGTRYGRNGFMVVPIERYDAQMSVGMWAVRETIALEGL